MVLANKLNIENEVELAKEEERLSKLKAKELFSNGLLQKLALYKTENLGENG